MQKAMDARCDVYDASPEPIIFPPEGCPQLRTQSQKVANLCSQKQVAVEPLDECESFFLFTVGCFWMWFANELVQGWILCRGICRLLILRYVGCIGKWVV